MLFPPPPITERLPEAVFNIPPPIVEELFEAVL